MKIKQVVDALEHYAPLPLQEGYDNAGLQVGLTEAVEMSGALLCLDVTEAVVEEAIQKGCNLIVSHHPLIFRKLARISDENYVQRTVRKAIKNDITIVAMHTNMDAAAGGVNFKIAEKMGLENVQFFAGEKEVDDIISSPVVKETIINNSDCKILLDQRKYQNKFDQIQNLLGLTDKERSQILSINLANAANRLYKEVWIGLGGTQSAVYATEVSAEEYLCYTTEETEKLELTRLTEKLDGNIELAIRQLAENKRQENKQSFNP